MKERREHKRLDLTGSITFEMSESLSEMKESAQQRGEGKAVDVSEGGLSLITQRAMENDQIIRVKVPLPGLSVHAPTLAKIRWSKPHNDKYQVGMSFII